MVPGAAAPRHWGQRGVPAPALCWVMLLAVGAASSGCRRLFLPRNRSSFAFISVLLFFSGVDHVDTRTRNSRSALDAASAADAIA